MITVSESAARQLRILLEERGGSDVTGLRLLVQKGGCAGMEYAMKLDMPAGDDQIYQQKGVSIIVDPESLRMLGDSEIDYSDSLSDAGFKVHNPNAVRSCGCGTSFEPKAG